jgi:uncharacterized membrane protein
MNLAATVPPNWLLVIAYWLHMLATVTWIGGLVTLSWLVVPAARRSLDAPSYHALLERLQNRLQSVGWFSMVLLVGTGMFQLSANPNYSGFLAINNRWTLAILVKHLIVVVMVAISAYLTWFLLPSLRRAAMRQAQGLISAEASEKLRQRERSLLRLNLALALVVLALTALARAS